jgi:hypothetical protein
MGTGELRRSGTKPRATTSCTPRWIRSRSSFGGAYTLSELTAEYHRAESWAREAIAQLPRQAQWQGGLTAATDAAFHLYARGAQDYEP